MEEHEAQELEWVQEKFATSEAAHGFRELLKETVMGDVQNVYLVGSRLYGCASPHSDYDFLMVTSNKKAKYQYIYKENAGVDAGIYGFEYWEMLLCEVHEPFVVFCSFLPQKNIWKENIRFPFTIRYNKLRSAVCHAVDKNTAIGKRFWKEGTSMYKAYKKLVFTLRMIHFAIQIVLYGKICEFSVWNELLQVLVTLIEKHELMSPASTAAATTVTTETGPTPTTADVPTLATPFCHVQRTLKSLVTASITTLSPTLAVIADWRECERWFRRLSEPLLELLHTITTAPPILLHTPTTTATTTVMSSTTIGTPATMPTTTTVPAATAAATPPMINNTNIQSYLRTFSQCVHNFGLQKLEQVYSIRRTPCIMNNNSDNDVDIIQLHYTTEESPLYSPLVHLACGSVVATHKNNSNNDDSNNNNNDNNNNNSTSNNDHSAHFVALAFPKFFSYKQPESRDALQQIDWHSIKIYEMLDGVQAILFFYAGTWHVSCMSSFASLELEESVSEFAQPVTDSFTYTRHVDMVVQYEEIFWKIWREKGYQLPANTHQCYVFQMCSPKCRHIVVYEEERLVLIGVRDMGTLLERNHVTEAQTNRWECTQPLSVAHLSSLSHSPSGATNVATDQQQPANVLKAVVMAVDRLSLLKYKGFVLCDRNFTRVSVLCLQYEGISDVIMRMKPSMVQPKHFAMFMIDVLCSRHHQQQQQQQPQEQEQQNQSDFEKFFPPYAYYYAVMRDKTIAMCHNINDMYHNIMDVLNSNNNNNSSIDPNTASQLAKSFAQQVKLRKLKTSMKAIMFTMQKHNCSTFENLVTQRLVEDSQIEKWIAELTSNTVL